MWEQTHSREPTTDEDPPGEPPPPDGLSSSESELLSALNKERESRGLDPVTITPALLCAARDHSEDIGDRQACTHTGASGSSPGDRVAACDGGGWSGEIVACGQRSANEAVASWLSSPGHRDIMLDPGQRTVGVAVHENHWTAVFNQ